MTVMVTMVMKVAFPPRKQSVASSARTSWLTTRCRTTGASLQSSEIDAIAPYPPMQWHSWCAIVSRYVQVLHSYDSLCALGI